MARAVGGQVLIERVPTSRRPIGATPGDPSHSAQSGRLFVQHRLRGQHRQALSQRRPDHRGPQHSVDRPRGRGRHVRRVTQGQRPIVAGHHRHPKLAARPETKQGRLRPPQRLTDHRICRRRDGRSADARLGRLRPTQARRRRQACRSPGKPSLDSCGGRRGHPPSEGWVCPSVGGSPSGDRAVRLRGEKLFVFRADHRMRPHVVGEGRADGFHRKDSPAALRGRPVDGTDLALLSDCQAEYSSSGSLKAKSVW